MIIRSGSCSTSSDFPRAPTTITQGERTPRPTDGPMCARFCTRRSPAPPTEWDTAGRHGSQGRAGALHRRQDRAQADARGRPSLPHTTQAIRLLSGRAGQGRQERPEPRLHDKSSDEKARHRRHRVQGGGRQGVPIARHGPLQQRNRGVVGIEERQHGPDDGDARRARAAPSRPRSPAFRPRMAAPTAQLSESSRLERMGLVQSMSRKATCLDNACIEGFFGHMKDEFFRGREFDSFDSFKEQLDSYITYWNTRRYQVRLKGMTPVQYRGHSIRAT